MASEFLERQKNDFFRDITSFGSLWFYAIILLIFLVLKNYGMVNKLLIGFVLIYLITIIIKSVYFKNRPEKYSYNNFLEKLDASSFPSLHAERTVFLSIILMKFFNNLYISIILLILGAIVVYSRIQLKKHDFKDVLGGGVLGIIIYLVISIKFIY